MRIKLHPADSLFSNLIRERDGWRCQRCGGQHTPPTRGLHCSHYFGRGNKTTRFDPRNCVALCFACHLLWGHGDERDDYTAFMIKKLGLKGFKDLRKTAMSTIKFGEYEFKEMAKLLRKNLMLVLKERNKGMS